MVFVLKCWHVYSAFCFFFKQSKLQKIGSIRIIEILLSITKNNLNRHGTCHATYSLSIPSLSSLSPFRLSLPSIHSLHSLDYVMEEVQLSTSEYTSIFDLHITTLFLARRYTLASTYRLRQLTSYSFISHSSPNFHPSLLCCGDFLLKCYCYLFYT